MRAVPRKPFHNLTADAWKNLALAAILAFYVAQFAFDLLWGNMCGHLGIDYCSFWSAGTVAEHSGYADVYRMDVIGAIQKSVSPPSHDPAVAPGTIPIPYLPIFLLPFTLLAPLGPFLGYWVWTVINLGALIYYMRRFALQMTGTPIQKRLLIFILLAWPVFLNTFYGQVNIWLTVFIGEYMRASVAGKPLRAGLWLGGMLLKPQFLILIGLTLLMQRSMKVIAGLGMASVALLGMSYAMVGSAGFLSLLQLWLGFAKGIAETGPNVMMNWRMVGIFFATITNNYAAWGMAAAGMLLSAVLGLAAWRQPLKPGSVAFNVAMLGLLAATSVVAWHSHIYSATILICPLICLSQPTNRLPRQALAAWVIVLPAMQLVTILMAGMVQTEALPADVTNLTKFLTAIAPFGFNLYFLGWAFASLHMKSPTESVGDLPS